MVSVPVISLTEDSTVAFTSVASMALDVSLHVTAGDDDSAASEPATPVVSSSG